MFYVFFIPLFRMKKLMFAYLNTTYPNAYVYYCKFGYLVYYGDIKLFNVEGSDNHISRHYAINKLITLFDCNEDLATNMFEDWWRTLPMYERIPNTTNELVLVPHKSTSYATTL